MTGAARYLSERLIAASAFEPGHQASPWVRFNVAYRSPALSAWWKAPR